ncbi:MAG TPA: aspartate aminotransferase family protein [Spirochaetia bacterium]|nr:aspartate aminotransferase family protein [Spirochaetia bacterium]
MKSDEIYEVAQKYMVAGVSAGGRYHPTIKKPLILDSVDGCYMRDVDGNTWIDFHSCSGATILGFNHPAITEAVEKAVQKGYFINFESEYHTKLAEKIHEMIPSAEKVRLSNSGTEATLAAIRVARAHTGKDKILKFEGHFHGMHEFVFYNWHNRLGAVDASGEIAKVRDSGGLMNCTDDLVIVIPFNDIELAERTLRRHKDEIAAVILEPVMFNAGCIEAVPGYLQKIRDITRELGIVLIFDEVLSGFRMHPGGAQGYYGVYPDLTTLGKVLGCGMTIAALVGTDEVMSELNPRGSVVVSGTYTGPLIGVMGALAGLGILSAPGFYEKLNAEADHFYGKLNRLLSEKGVKAIVQGLGARFGIYFGLDHPTNDYREAARNYDGKVGQKFYELVMKKGLYFHNYGAGLTPMHSGITAVHTRKVLDESLNRLSDVFAQMSGRRP